MSSFASGTKWMRPASISWFPARNLRSHIPKGRLGSFALCWVHHVVHVHVVDIHERHQVGPDSKLLVRHTTHTSCTFIRPACSSCCQAPLPTPGGQHSRAAGRSTSPAVHPLHSCHALPALLFNLFNCLQVEKSSPEILQGGVGNPGSDACVAAEANGVP